MLNWKVKILMVFSILTLNTVLIENSSNAAEKKWYQGGTLHAEKMLKWVKSKEDNRLATAGDFLAGSIQNGTINITVSSMDELKSYAVSLKSCIDKVGKNKKQLNQNVSDVSILCMYQLGWK